MKMSLRDNCYCCCSTLPRSSRMDVDAALSELGMLSAVTESRKQFLEERKRSKSESKLSQYDNSVGTSKRYRVIHIDPSYVTNFNIEGGSTNEKLTFKCGDLSENIKLSLTQNGLSSDFQYRIPSDRLENDTRERRLARMRTGRLRRFRKPYEVPWRLYHSFQDSDLGNDSSSSSPKSKSNSSSPVKLADAPLIRSKSLDNLDFTKLRLSDLFEKESSSEKQIETVSKEMKKLQVNDLM